MNHFAIGSQRFRSFATSGSRPIITNSVVPMPKAAGKWNTYDITAKGDHLVVIFNGQKTVDVTDKRLLNAGFVGLQYGSGVVKFRKVQIRSL